ncbi:MAG: hypothetical protein R3A13_03275 [Bdellovibrionota bacterium]
MIEDSLNGLRAANSAGSFTIFYTAYALNKGITKVVDLELSSYSNFPYELVGLKMF